MYCQAPVQLPLVVHVENSSKGARKISFLLSKMNLLRRKNMNDVLITSVNVVVVMYMMVPDTTAMVVMTIVVIGMVIEVIIMAMDTVMVVMYRLQQRSHCPYLQSVGVSGGGGGARMVYWTKRDMLSSKSSTSPPEYVLIRVNLDRRGTDK